MFLKLLRYVSSIHNVKCNNLAQAGAVRAGVAAAAAELSGEDAGHHGPLPAGLPPVLTCKQQCRGSVSV